MKFKKLTKEEGKKRLALLRKYDTEYHSKGNSKISDDKYDFLKEELRRSFPKLSYLKEVGAEVIGKKVKLPIELGGFDQLRPKEVEAWAKKLIKKYGTLTFVCFPKLDGISCLLEYEKQYKGYVLIGAYTRGRIKPGDTEQKGKFVLDHIKLVQGARRVLKASSIYKPKCKKIYIRGELICHRSLFDKIKGEPLPHKPEGYTNPRGFVSGVFNTDDVSGDVYKKLMRYMTFIGFGVIIGDKSINKLTQLEMLESWGITNIRNPTRIHARYNKFLKLHNRPKSDVRYYNPVQNFLVKQFSENNLIDILTTNRSRHDINQDGLVIEVADEKVRRELGGEGNYPEYAKKIKPEREHQETKIGVLGKIEWSFTSRRIYKPIGILKEPIDFNGIKFSRASLHNAKNVKDMNLEIGCKVKCIRAGDCIPYIGGKVEN